MNAPVILDASAVLAWLNGEPGGAGGGSPPTGGSGGNSSATSVCSAVGAMIAVAPMLAAAIIGWRAARAADDADAPPRSEP